MGATCSKCSAVESAETTMTAIRPDAPDPAMYALMRRSVELTDSPRTKPLVVPATNPPLAAGQTHLLYKQQSKFFTPAAPSVSNPATPSASSRQKETPATGLVTISTGTPVAFCPTRIVVRRHSLQSYEEGFSGTHIYAVRYPADQPLELTGHHHGAHAASGTVGQEQAPRKRNASSSNPGPSSSAAVSRKKSLDGLTGMSIIAQSSSSTTITSRTVTLLEPPRAFVEIKGKEEDVDRLFHPSVLSVTPKHIGECI
jgi:hypothetical protein